MNRLTDLFLRKRGYDSNSVLSIDTASPDTLKDIDVLCERLHEYHETGNLLVILPDFDMDGIAAGTLGYAGLSELGFKVDLYIPHPEEGYGFTPTSIDRLVAEHPHVKGILTCDVGIGCVEGTRHAVRDLGLEVLVTDHHVEDVEHSTRGIASVVVNPCRDDETYALHEICGAHVLWQVLDYYAHTYANKHMVDQINRLRVFAGLGTVSDSMALLHENRPLVRDAIHIMRMIWSCGDGWFLSTLSGCKAYRDAFRGLARMCDEFAEAGKLSQPENIDEGFFGFYLAPTFNACKRIGEPMRTAFGVFDESMSIWSAKRLMEVNEQRKKLVEESFAEMLESADDRLAPYAYVIDADPGILGLLAQKGLSKSGMPTLVLRPQVNGRFTGSGRSPAWYDFPVRADSKLAYRAGHAAAFGCGFDSFDQVLNYAAFMGEDVESPEILNLRMDTSKIANFDFVVASEQVQVCNNVIADIDFDISTLVEFCTDVDKYRPFGQGFPAPRALLVFDSAEAFEYRRMGSSNEHLKIMLPYGMQVVMWNSAYRLDDGKTFDGLVGIVGSFAVNEWNGNKSLQFVGNDFVPQGLIPVKA